MKKGLCYCRVRFIAACAAGFSPDVKARSGKCGGCGKSEIRCFGGSVDEELSEVSSVPIIREGYEE